MEIDGHPTQDMVDELCRRGGQRHPGNSLGPSSTQLGADGTRVDKGLWLFLPEQAYDTEIDDPLN